MSNLLSSLCESVTTGTGAAPVGNMRDDENGNDEKPPQDLSEPDLLAELMGLMSREGINDNKLRKILVDGESVLSERERLALEGSLRRRRVPANI